MTGQTNVERDVAGDEAADQEIQALVLHEGASRAVNALDEVKRFFSNAPEQYNQQGVVTTRADIVRLDWLTEQIVSVQVRWPYLTEDGKELGDERSTYLVMRDNGRAWKIWAVVMQGVSKPH